MRYRYLNDKNWWKRHSLSLALVGVLIVQALIVLLTGYPEFAADAAAHGESVKTLDFIIWFVYEMTVSIIADTYGALLLVMFAKWFYEEGSPESE
jgi:DNA-binding LytR/AlgR family response regulator